MALARPVGAMLAHDRRVVSEPWRLTGALEATPLAASVQHAAFRYGPEERALNFSGEAAVAFAAHPRLRADISALQLDIDRALADPDTTNRPPAELLRSFLKNFVTSAKLPVPAEIALRIDEVTVGGTSLELLDGGLAFDQAGWNVKNLQFRAPGMTNVTVKNGRLNRTAQGFEFNGAVQMQSADRDTLAAWFNGHSRDRNAAQVKPMNAQGVVTFASDRVAVDNINATLDGENIQGHLDYGWGVGDRPSRLDAGLSAADLDLGTLSAFAAEAKGGGIAWPKGLALAIDLGKASFAGVQAQAVKARIKYDAGKLQIDQMSIGDLAGATLAVDGRIDNLSSQPQGKLTLQLDARALQGVSDILAQFRPQAADTLRRAADRLAPASVHAELTLRPAAKAGSNAELEVTGTMAAMRITVHGDASGEPTHLGNASFDLKSRNRRR